ncbi:MAG: UDP-N-acetylmuramoyl-L-alanine--D-glutamate ligase, partial [Kiritimatiellia bacterium]
MADTRTALILGLGRSGYAAARLLCAQGCRVTIVDQSGGTLTASDLLALNSIGACVLPHQQELPAGAFDLGVVSPGFAVTSPWVIAAEARCRELLSELALGYRYSRCPLLAVTGTNGKSTLVMLLDTILRQAGHRSLAGGNLGIPLCELVMRPDVPDWIVVEVSSFQLELAGDFHPHGAVFLNIQPDHLDRHGDMDTYFRTKCRVFSHMQAGDIAVVPAGLLVAIQGRAGCMHAQSEPEWICFGEHPAAWCYDAQNHCLSGPREKIPLLHPYFDNPVTGATAAAAAALVSGCCGVSGRAVADGIAAFTPLGHRTELVAQQDDVMYIDDSKATNMAAMCAALAMQKGPVRLIAGGLLKENDLDWTKQVLKKRVACAYLIGDAA